MASFWRMLTGDVPSWTGAGDGWGVGSDDVSGGGALCAEVAKKAMDRMERIGCTHTRGTGTLEAAAA